MLQVTRDPRFDDLSGEFNEKIFKKTYNFLTDVKKKEKLVSSNLCPATVPGNHLTRLLLHDGTDFTITIKCLAPQIVVSSIFFFYIMIEVSRIFF